MSPTVSVVMPLYEVAKYVRSALDSILAQTFTDWELIAICEPDSNDDTNSIIEEYAAKDSRIKQYVNSTRMGISASLNKGIRIASGEYIARMDGDDICLPTRFETQVNFLHNNRDVSILGTNSEFVDEHGANLGHTDDYSTNPDQVKCDLLFYCYIRHPTAMMRKADILRYNLFYDESLQATEDYELWCRACRYVRIANLPDITVLYRWYEQNATHLNNDKGIPVYRSVMKQNFLHLGIEFSEKEIDLLCPLTAATTLFDFPAVRRFYKTARRRILSANEAAQIYESRCLDKTLMIRMSALSHPVRTLFASIARSLYRLTGLRKLNSLGNYLEEYGFKRTFARLVKTTGKVL